MARWRDLREALGVDGLGGRFATAGQVHGTRVLTHHPGWDGWLRTDGADGHFSRSRGTAFGVSVADCVPALLAHPSGAAAVVHAGWRGTAARILIVAIELFEAHGLTASELRIHLGPAICGECYEVGPDVFEQLTGRSTSAPATVDLASSAGRAGACRGRAPDRDESVVHPVRQRRSSIHIVRVTPVARWRLWWRCRSAWPGRRRRGA